MYCWIERSENGFIQEQGFNFYGEHQFSVKKEEKEGEENKYILEYEHKNEVLGSALYKDSTVVTNISAIVGENGSGKSTMLGEILRLDEFSKVIDSNEGVASKKNQVHKKYLYVLRKGKNKFHLSHNFNFNNFKLNITGVQTLPREEFSKDYMTAIFFTNSQDTPIASLKVDDIQKQARKVVLTPKSISNLNDYFLRKLLKISNGTSNTTGLYDVNDPKQCLYEDFTTTYKGDTYQGIYDTLYFSDEEKRDKKTEITLKTKRKIKISAKKIVLQIRYGQSDEEFQEVWNNYREDSLLLKEKLKTAFPSTWQFYRALLLEYKYYYQKNLDFSALVHTVDGIMNSISSQGNNEKEKEILNEITEFGEIFQQISDNHENEVSESYVLVSDKSVVYQNLSNFLKKKLIEDYSFVLRYLDIQYLGMSSGERAILNFRSWFNLLPHFPKFTGISTGQIGDSILLLVDEIDLYVHPEWQRKLINHLIAELEQQFPDNKIQIILTTHSPFVLSDIPVENCTFLKPKNGEFAVKTKDLPQTFAANLHTIAKKQFFMESTMGAYAQKKLNELDAAFQTEEKIRIDCRARTAAIALIESRDTEVFINSIGEPIIHQYFKKKREKYYQKKLGNDEIEVQDIIKGRSEKFLAQLGKALEERRGEHG
ncbi:MAG: AAA family ATPase [Eubacteriales bacterium]